MHIILQLSVEDINDFLVNLSITGISRRNPHKVKQALQITPDLLGKFANILNLTNKEDVVYWCLCIFALFLFARKSNLVPTSQDDVLKEWCLLRKHVSFENGILLVSMDWTKTIQFGERQLLTPLIPIEGSIFKHVSFDKS